MAQNLRINEVLGLFYQFLGATCIGIGFYTATWFATRSIFYREMTPPTGWDWIAFPVFFGLGGALWSLGKIELKEARPGYNAFRK